MYSNCVQARHCFTCFPIGDSGVEVLTSPTTTESPPLPSVPLSPEKTKPHRAPSEDKVYTVATDKTIKTLMQQYKKRKQAHSMPSFVKATRSKPAPAIKERKGSGDPADREVEEQQKSSIMKVRILRQTKRIEDIV